MKRTTMVILGGLAVVGLSWAVAAGLKPAPEAPTLTGAKAGSKAAPAFSLPAVPGPNRVALADHKGKVVLVNFWATWCPPCRQEVPDFVKVQGELRPKGFEIVGVSLDESAKPVAEFMTKYAINYPVGIDNGEVAAMYGGVSSIPTSFLLDRGGNVVETFQGAIDEETLRSAVTKLL